MISQKSGCYIFYNFDIVPTIFRKVRSGYRLRGQAPSAKQAREPSAIILLTMENTFLRRLLCLRLLYLRLVCPTGYFVWRLLCPRSIFYFFQFNGVKYRFITFYSLDEPDTKLKVGK